jgi:putative peptidoglycan lipid II flippase
VTLPVAAVLAIGLQPLLTLAFNFGQAGTTLLTWVTAAFMAGLLGQCLKEIGARSFLARQNAWIPLITAGINVVLYISIGSLLYRPLGAPGIALTDSLVFTIEAVLLLIILNRKMVSPIQLGSGIWRPLAAMLTAGLVTWETLSFLTPRVSPLIYGTVPMILGFLICLPWIWKEMRALTQL